MWKPTENNHPCLPFNNEVPRKEDNMYEHPRKTTLVSIAALLLSAVVISTPALAFGGHTWHGGHGGWHGGWGGAAVGAGVGFAAGTIAGAALASPYYYGTGYCDPYYGCNYGPSYNYAPGYYNDFGPQYPLAPQYPYYSTGGNSGGANFPP
jgi:hypothetical protein